MKMKALPIFLLTFLLILGCASLPDKERPKIPPQKEEAAKSKPPPEEGLKELVIPQMEEEKSPTNSSPSTRFKHPDVLLAFQRQRIQHCHDPT
jgi:hypothetical protein